MPSSEPAMIQWLLPTLIAAFVAVIGFLQWRTAHQRVVLDLFDRRMKVYEQARKSAAFVVAHGNSDPKIEREMTEAVEASRFVYGNEIRDYLDSIYEAILDVGMHESEKPGLHGDDLRRTLDLRGKAFEKVRAFLKDGPAKFEPYLKLDQKNAAISLFQRLGNLARAATRGRP